MKDGVINVGGRRVGRKGERWKLKRDGRLAEKQQMTKHGIAYLSHALSMSMDNPRSLFSYYLVPESQIDKRLHLDTFAFLCG